MNLYDSIKILLRNKILAHKAIQHFKREIRIYERGQRYLVKYVQDMHYFILQTELAYHRECIEEARREVGDGVIPLLKATREYKRVEKEMRTIRLNNR